MLGSHLRTPLLLNVFLLKTIISMWGLPKKNRSEKRLTLSEIKKKSKHHYVIDFRRVTFLCFFWGVGYFFMDPFTKHVILRGLFCLIVRINFSVPHTVGIHFLIVRITFSVRHTAGIHFSIVRITF